MLLTFETQVDKNPGIGNANVALGLFAVAEALRLGNRGEADRAISWIEKELRLPFRMWRYLLAPLEVSQVSVRRGPVSDLVVASLTSGQLSDDVAVLTRFQIGSLEAEIEKLLDRLRRPFRRIVESATERAHTQTDRRGPGEADSRLLETVRSSVDESVEGTDANRRATMRLVAASTAWLRDGLSQIRVRNVRIED
jgi:hypothetical protein